VWERDPVIRWYPGLLQKMMDARFESSAMKILGSILKVVGFKISSQGNSENVGPSAVLISSLPMKNLSQG